MLHWGMSRRAPGRLPSSSLASRGRYPGGLLDCIEKYEMLCYRSIPQHRPRSQSKRTATDHDQPRARIRPVVPSDTQRRKPHCVAISELWRNQLPFEVLLSNPPADSLPITLDFSANLPLDQRHHIPWPFAATSWKVEGPGRQSCAWD
jgi:hypothetical protein